MEEIRAHRNELQKMRETMGKVHTSVTELKTHREHDEKRMGELATKEYVKSQTWRVILTGVGLVITGVGLLIRFL
ncbi:hypothetical protein ACFOUO_06225 [Salinithrix halophila]|uniref:Hemolysin XhlA n=1 Tax=Salinithrix halophila TaxID=1485204 RepID=A0ABV8JGQ7_9BACL